MNGVKHAHRTRMPMRTIVRRFASPGGTLLEELECGHIVEQIRDIKHRPTNSRRRRCRACDAATGGDHGNGHET